MCNSSFQYGGSGDWEQASFDATGTWRLLELDPAGDVLGQTGIGGLTLPDGLIDAAGLYADVHGVGWRFDNFTAWSQPVPEPSSLALMAMGVGPC